MRKIIIIALIGTLILATGCSKDENVKIDANNSSVAKENIEANNQESDEKEGSTVVKDTTINIYAINDDNDETVVIKEITPDKNKALKEEVEEVASVLSKEQFQDLPIELSKIDNIDGKKVAIINLKENEKNYGKINPEDFTSPNWLYQKFQGTYGFMVTYQMLVESFLQRHYKGEWIDGVKFLYDGQQIPSEHADRFEDIIYR